MKDRCAIVGVGNTAYTRGTDKTTVELHLEAALSALADAGLEPSDLDAVMPNEMSGVIAEDLLMNLGVDSSGCFSRLRSIKSERATVPDYSAST